MNEDKVGLAIDEHNKKIEPFKWEGFIVIASGSKKKRFTVYLHEVYQKVKTAYPSKFNKKFVQYLTGTQLELSKVKILMRKYNKCLFKVEVDSLRDSQENVAEFEPWMFMPWGKYKYEFIDDLPEIDPEYCLWLIKTREEKKGTEWGEFEYNNLDRHILSEEFRSRVNELWGKKVKQAKADELKNDKSI
jgi:uncharacterized protein (DUF3820 family)